MHQVIWKDLLAYSPGQLSICKLKLLSLYTILNIQYYYYSISKKKKLLAELKPKFKLLSKLEKKKNPRTKKTMTLTSQTHVPWGHLTLPSAIGFVQTNYWAHRSQAAKSDPYYLATGFQSQ